VDFSQRDIQIAVGKQVIQRREAAGWTQAELGARLEARLGRTWPRQAVSAAEKGRRAFTAAELFAIADALGCGVPDLLRVDPSVQPLDIARVRLESALVEVRQAQASLSRREADLLAQLTKLGPS
jgi:transcriptional regulator with XRE-family HTH domain